MKAGLENLLEGVQSSADRRDPLIGSLIGGLVLFAAALAIIGWVTL
jgi:hypothetical protein